ncbi:MAG: phosphatase PAP2 family protein [Candidatus Saccharimonas sp.]
MRTFLASFDATIGNWIHTLPAWLHGLMYSVSFIGQPLITIPIVVAIGILATTAQQYRLLIASIVALGTYGVNSILKELFHRARPDTGYAEQMILETYSFPSGHAASSVVIFGLIALIAWYSLPQPYALIAAILLVVLILLIGLSRVYLGAHYPTDVVIGWCVGLVGLAIIVWIVRPFV